MARTRQNVKRKIFDTIMVLILVAGLGVLSYPFVRNSLNDLINQKLISHYQAESNQKSKEEYQQQLEKMEEMNRQFAYQNISPGFDPFSEEAKEIEQTKVIYEDHIIGVISIPKIAVRLPIFDQTTEAFLAKGAAYLEGTSFPIGGETTHSVISGHRGLTEAKLFTDLPELVKGDHFYIELGKAEIHAYQVDDIKVVEPTDVSSLQIEKTKVIYEDHIIGVISIPKIAVRLPIFDQTTEAFLAKGAAYLEGTSFPIGGETTHSVISGHRGLTEAKLFTDLPDLVKGDHFYIELGEAEIHAYQVDDIKVVEPTDVSSLQIEKGKDYITLVTCTPYMINSHRLLVRGHRVPYVPELMESEVKEAKVDYYTFMPIVILGLVLFLILIVIFRKFRRSGKSSPTRS